MKSSAALGYLGVVFGAAAVVASLLLSYEGAVVSIVLLGLALGVRSVLAGAPVRQWATHKRPHGSKKGPVTSLAVTLEDARRGSYYSQSEIAVILRGMGPKAGLSDQIMKPSDEGRRLKGGRYMTELENTIRVLKDV